MGQNVRFKRIVPFALSGAMLITALLPTGVHAEGAKTPTADTYTESIKTPTNDTYVEGNDYNGSKDTTSAETQSNNTSEDKFKIVYKYGYASKDYQYDMGGFWGSYDKVGSSETEVNESDIDFERYKKDHNNKDLDYDCIFDNIYDIGEYLNNNAPVPKLPDAPPEVPDGWEFLGWKEGDLTNGIYNDGKKVIVNTYVAEYKHPDTMVFMDAAPDWDGDGVSSKDEASEWYFWQTITDFTGETDYTYPEEVTIDGRDYYLTYYLEDYDSKADKSTYTFIDPPTIKLKEGEWVSVPSMPCQMSVSFYKRDPKTTEIVRKNGDHDGGIKHNAEILKKDISKVKEASEKAAISGKKETVTIDMSDGANLIPAEILQEMKGKNVDVVFDMGDYSWTINGNDIQTDALKDLNLNVSLDYDYIPNDIIAKLAEKNPVQQLLIAHNGEFGFKATLSINALKDTIGKYGNLYWYTWENGAKLIASSKVTADGKLNLVFTHASPYVIVYTDKSLSVSNSDSKDGTKNAASDTTAKNAASNTTTKNTAITKSPKTGETSQNLWYLYIILLTASALCLAFGSYEWKKEN
ncbi:MAG: hypothetical protein PUC75_04885 [Lachnospiraceae bacterium]|nr:hypothetical protein [Lachnospiraceae bacterium]MDD6578221.1 hypothetical protein [Lachnospiraceae bacterium]